MFSRPAEAVHKMAANSAQRVVSIYVATQMRCSMLLVLLVGDNPIRKLSLFGNDFGWRVLWELNRECMDRFG
jgi:hypothetical protein